MPHPTALAAAATFIGFAARAVQANSGSDSSSDSGFGLPTDFQRCFCWDSAKGQMCGGSDFFNSEPCQDWLVNHFWWLPVALAAVIGLLVFPCIFYCARCCCNCCGGRHGSYGACCPTEMGRAAFPGYRNSSILMTKLFFFVCLGISIGFSVRGLQHNSDLDSVILNAADSVDGAFQTYKSDISGLQQTLQTVPNSAPYQINLIPQALQDAVQGAYGELDFRARDAHDRLHDIKNTETKARDSLSKMVVIQGLVLFGLGLLLAVFSFRQAVGMVMVGFCLHMAIAVFVLAPHQVLRIASNSVCDNFDSTIVPLATGALQSAGVCGSSAVQAGLNDVAGRFANFVTDGNSQFCQDYNAACTSVGSPTCWQTPCNSYNQPFPQMTPTTISSTDVAAAYFQIASFVSIVAPNQYEYTEAQYRLQTFVNSQAVNLPSVAATASKVGGCQHATNVLQNVIRPAVCGDSEVQGKSRAMAADLTVLIGTGLFTIVVLIFGMKRFRRVGSYQSNMLFAVVEEQQPIINVTTTTVAIVGKVCTAEDGTAQTQLYGYPAQYGATETNNDYRTLN